jgi:predicted metal-binding protein
VKQIAKDKSLRAISQRITDLGAREAKIIDPKTVETAPWVRWKCQYGCGGYNSSLMCPPHTPTPEETRMVLDSYKRAILFEAGRLEPKKIAVQMEREAFLSGYYKAFGLGAGPCRFCNSCAFAQGCRHPDEARPAMEACGIDVFATVRKHGFTIEVVKNRKDPRHYFGLVLIE